MNENLTMKEYNKMKSYAVKRVFTLATGCKNNNVNNRWFALRIIYIFRSGKEMYENTFITHDEYMQMLESPLFMTFEKYLTIKMKGE